MTAVSPHQSVRLFPLDDFYQRHGAELPPVYAASPEEVPQPQRHLLVHEGDMTLRLQQFHGQPIGLCVLEHQVTPQTVTRTVVLVREDGRAVEFGSICIFLAPFPVEARQEIIACRRPLGTILRGLHLGHYSRPSAFIRLRADDIIAPYLGVRPEAMLYGRCNELYDRFHQLLARVVEILPPDPRTPGPQFPGPRMTGTGLGSSLAAESGDSSSDTSLPQGDL